MIKALKRLLAWARRNNQRVDCRCCKAPLHKPGGACFYPLGCGFCYSCAAELLRHQNGSR